MADPTPICITHKKEMQCLKNSVSVLYLYDDGSPYKIYSADLYGCMCGNMQLKGFSKYGLESWEDGFDYLMERRNELPVEFQFEVCS